MIRHKVNRLSFLARLSVLNAHSNYSLQCIRIPISSFLPVPTFRTSVCFPTSPCVPFLIPAQNRRAYVMNLVQNLFLYCSYNWRTLWRHLMKWVSFCPRLNLPGQCYSFIYFLFFILLKCELESGFYALAFTVSGKPFNTEVRLNFALYLDVLWYFGKKNFKLRRRNEVWSSKCKIWIVIWLHIELNLLSYFVLPSTLHI